MERKVRWETVRKVVAGAAIAAAIGLAELYLRARYRARVRIDAPPHRDVVTIVALGDSITAGEQVAAAEAWPAQLATLLLEAHPGTTWQVRNAGVPGDTAPQGLARFDRDVAASAPDAVLIAFGLNDCHLNRHALDLWLEARVPAGLERSYLWRALQSRLRRAALRTNILRPPTPEKLSLPLPRTTPAGFRAALTELVTRTKTLGARPVLLTMTPLADGAVSTERAATYAPYNAHIHTVAQHEAIPCVALSQGAPVGAWVSDGVHLTGTGQRWVAENVYGQLDAEGLWARLAELRRG